MIPWKARGSGSLDALSLRSMFSPLVVKFHSTWSSPRPPVSVTSPPRFTLELNPKLKTTESPAASPLIVTTLPSFSLYDVTLKTRLPLPSKVPAEALIVMLPLMLIFAPASPPRLVESELTSLSAVVTAAVLKFTEVGPTFMPLLLLNWPAFAAEKSTRPPIVLGPLSITTPLPPTPILPFIVTLAIADYDRPSPRKGRCMPPRLVWRK